MDELRQSGIEVVGAVRWGTHVCQFYETSQDLVETLVPYFREGLAANEFCMWITSPPLQVEEAKAALRGAVPALGDYVARGQIEILDYGDWYTKSGELRTDEVLQGWVDKHDDALRRGYEGLRLSGNTLWLEQTQWDDFAQYEKKVNDIIGQYRMLAVCTYSLKKCSALEIADVIANHQFTLVKRSGRWQIIESSRHRMTEAMLLEASRAVLRHREFEAAARSIFDSCKGLIGATAGYVAMLNKDGTENELLFLESGGLPCSVDASLPMPIRGLRAVAYESGQAVCENDFANSKWVGLLPQGHAQLQNVLFAPLVVDGAVVGILGLANKPGGFTRDDLGVASAFAELAAVALHNSRTLEALEHSEERYRSLVETAVDAIISIDSHGNIVLWNRGAESMFGYRPHDVMGKPLEFIMPERFREAHREAVQRVFSTGKANIIGRTVELAGLRRTGVEFPLELSLAKWGSGDAVFCTAVIRDITERKRAEETLRQHREDLNRAQAVAHTGSWRLDVRHNELRWSDETYRMFGIPEGTPLDYEAFLGTVHPDDREYVDREWAAAMSGQPYDIEHRIVVGDIVKWVRERAELEFDEQGALLGGFGTVTDITQRKHDEEALRETRDYLEKLIDFANAPIIVWDPSFTVTRFNHAFERLTGRPAGEVIGQPLEVLFPEETRAASMKEIARTLRGELWELIEIPILHQSGEVRQVLWNSANITGPDGRTVAATIAQGTDITERKQAEEAVEQERQRLQTLVETSPVGILLADAGGRLLLVNGEAERLLGAEVHVGDTIEKYSRAIVRCRPDGSEYAEGELPLERALSQGESVRAEEIHFHRPDGSVVPVLVNAVPLYGPNREITGALAMQQDITPLEELERLRNEFLGIVSHELRTPLTAIKGSAATVLGSSSPLTSVQTRELFQIIDEQADRLRDLINDLLDMTRIEAGALSIEAAPADLREIIWQAREDFLRAVSVREVRLELPDVLPPVRADRHRIGQVMTNLLSNAAKFSPPSTPITVSVEHEPVYITVRVRDEGHGIAEEDLAKLFKKYSRPHEKSGLGLTGSGLGLAICKGIVEAHGGRIWAESEGEGRGATFVFTLQVAAEAAVADAGAAVAMTRISRPGQRKRILAVDDEVHVLRYLQRSLSEAGYEPVVASDPSEVNKLVELNEPDLIMLDLRFPGTSGFEVLERVRELTEAPVIFLTASDREDDAVRALRAGADDYIVKPFSPSELLARVDAVLRRRAGAPATAARRPFVLENLKIDFGQRQVTLVGKPVALSATEWKLLSQLATHAGMVITFEQILQGVWGPTYGGETELVRSFVRSLRRKLGDDARNPRFILTERGVGYRMPPAES